MVRHLIVFNTQAPEAEVQRMFEQARRVLGQIPGVVGFELGKAVGVAPLPLFAGGGFCR